MWVLFNIQIALGWNCPNHDLYADGLNAYAIVIDGQSWNFQMDSSIDNWSSIQERPVIQTWNQLLDACMAEQTQRIFDEWLTDWLYLSSLGMDLRRLSKWNVYQRLQLRQEIRAYERLLALGYAEFLRALQLETGIAVRWNREEYFWAKGMISSGGGSDLVADYVQNVWE